MPKTTKTPKPSAASKTRVAHSYVFFREGHEWHGCEVSVLAQNGRRWKVARCSDVADALLSKRPSLWSKLKTWTCTDEELW